LNSNKKHIVISKRILIITKRIYGMKFYYDSQKLKTIFSLFLDEYKFQEEKGNLFLTPVCLGAGS